MIPAKVARLIPRLATPFDGEVIATRNAIGRLLELAGLDWTDLAEACSVAAEERYGRASDHAPAHSHPESASFGDLARACRDLDRGRLSARERAFVADMVGRGFAFHPSPRQSAWLAAIFDRLAGRAAA